MDSMRDLLLYVDDEEQSLKYFRLTFAKEFEVITATDAETAWQLIEQHADRLALVISDQRMPGRSGVELLTAAKERCPQAARLLTTAYSDLTSAIDAVNRGAIFAYVTKPWKLDELRVVVKQALQLHHLQRERDALLAEKLSAFQHLLLVDQVRTLGIATAGLAGLVRRPLAAAAAWVRDRQDAFGIPSPVPADTRDLWSAVLAQSRTSVLTAQELGVWLARNRGGETTADVAGVLADGMAGTDGVIVADRHRCDLAIDARLLIAGIGELTRLLRSLLPDGGTASIRISHDGVPLLGLRISGGGAPDSDPDRTGLLAYLAIHHHLGSVSVVSWAPAANELAISIGDSQDDGMNGFIDRLALSEG